MAELHDDRAEHGLIYDEDQIEAGFEEDTYDEEVWLRGHRNGGYGGYHHKWVTVTPDPGVGGWQI